MIEQIGYVYASDISPRVKYKLARKNMYFSNNQMCIRDRPIHERPTAIAAPIYAKLLDDC